MQNNVYIGYHRFASPYVVYAIYQTLRTLGIDAFVDVEENDANSLDAVCLAQIAARVYFVVVLTPGSLDQFTVSQNLLCAEVEHALDTNRKLLVLATPEFKTDNVETTSSNTLRAVLQAERIVIQYS